MVAGNEIVLYEGGTYTTEIAIRSTEISLSISFFAE